MNDCFFPLEHAVLCPNCGNVSNSSNDHCIACAGTGITLLHLKRVLDREPFQPEKGSKPIFRVRG